MQELILEMIQYMNYLKNDCQLDISVHFDRTIFSVMPEYVANQLLPYNTHDNPYCMMVKSLEKGHRKCLYCQRQIIKRGNREQSFIGVCHAGVCEYVHVVYARKKAVGFVSVSGYRPKGAERNPLLAKHYKAYLTDTPIPKQLCQVLIPPLCRMFELFFSTIPERGLEGNEYLFMLHFIHERAGKVELSDLCRQFHRSPSHVSHMFKQQSGMTLKSYCNRLKIDDAKKLLLSTDFPITEIAFTSGFSDVSYFIQIFKSLTGQTPLKWRKSDRT